MFDEYVDCLVESQLAALVITELNMNFFHLKFKIIHYSINKLFIVFIALSAETDFCLFKNYIIYDADNDNQPNAISHGGIIKIIFN